MSSCYRSKTAQNDAASRNSAQVSGVNKLSWYPERSNVRFMRSVSNHIICVLLLAFSWSSVASPVVPCGRDFGRAPHQESTVDGAHDTHMNGHHESASQKDNSASDDCSCCEDCASMCPSSASSPVAMTLQDFIYSFSGSTPTRMWPDLMHDCPTPHPLFRPPISIS